MNFGNFGRSVRGRGGRSGVGGWSWMGGVRVPDLVWLLLLVLFRGKRMRLTLGGGCSVMGLCQAAVAEAVEAFGKLDILLCCSSEG